MKLYKSLLFGLLVCGMAACDTCMRHDRFGKRHKFAERPCGGLRSTGAEAE